MLESFAQAKNIISQGSFAVPNTASVKKVSTKERIPYHKPITEFTKKEISLLRHEFKKAKRDWKEYKDMDFEDQCFYYADYLIPETKKLKRRKKQTNTKAFITYVEFAKGQALLSDKHADHLIKNSTYYLSEVFEAQYKSENYLYLKETVKAFKKDPEGDKNAERYQRISPIYKEELEKEIAEEKAFNLYKAVVLTYFTWLQLGLCQTRVYHPGNPNKPLDPNTIDMSATLEDIHYCLSVATNIFSTIFNAIDLQATALFSLGMLASAQETKNNPVYEVFPEFIKGTVKYSQDESKKICKGYETIHEALYVDPQNCHEKGCVFLIGETNHKRVLTQTLMIFNWLSDWLTVQDKIQSVTIVYEVSSEKGLDKFITHVDQRFSSAMREPPQLQKNYLQGIYDNLCFNLLVEKEGVTSLGTEEAFACTTTLARSHGFEFILSDISGAHREAGQHTIEKFLQQYPSGLKLFSFARKENIWLSREECSLKIRKNTIEIMDRIMIDNTLSQVRQKPNNLIVVFTGQVHVPAIKKALQEEGYHPLVAILATVEQDMDIKVQQELSKNCIKTIDKCELDNRNVAKEQGVTHCIEPKLHDAKQGCDNQLHMALSVAEKRREQIKDSPVIPNMETVTKSRHFFFVPKQCKKEIIWRLKEPSLKVEENDQLKQEKRQMMG